MAKTETNVSTLKINRGTYAKVQENLSSITENELIITSDKNVPIPTTNDVGKAPIVNASGEYELGNAGTNVVANPTLAGTEANLTGLQVGDTKYAVPDGNYPINTYQQNKTYTSADTDYEQLRDDITNGRMIRIGIWIYQQTYNNGSVALYANTYRETATSLITSSVSISLNFASITISSSISLSMPKVVADSNIGNNITPSLYIGTALYSMVGTQTAYTTTAPTADNTSGYLKTIVLTSEPATYYNGYYYIIAPST